MTRNLPSVYARMLTRARIRRPDQPPRVRRLRLDPLEAREMPGNMWQGVLLGLGGRGMLEPLSVMAGAVGEEALLPKPGPVVKAAASGGVAPVRTDATQAAAADTGASGPHDEPARQSAAVSDSTGFGAWDSGVASSGPEDLPDLSIADLPARTDPAPTAGGGSPGASVPPASRFAGESTAAATVSTEDATVDRLAGDPALPAPVASQPTARPRPATDGSAASPAPAAPPGADDADGVPAGVEARGPNRGDGNADGVPDGLQPGVAAVPAATDGRFVVLDAPGHQLRQVRAVPAPGATAAGSYLPFGLFGFEVHGVTPGGTATVRLTLPPGSAPSGYLKPDPATGELRPFAFDGATGAVVSGDVVTLTLRDGGRGDEDGQANGVIVDPGGPGSQLPVVQTFYVPFPEDQLLASLNKIHTDADDPVHTFVAITAVADQTVIYFDHWEDGYEPDIAAPTQANSRVWGDANTANGTAPGTTDDRIDAGDVVILTNQVTSTNLSDIDFDGGDKFAATKTVSVTRMAWPSKADTLLAEAVEVYDVRNWGKTFRAPVGTDTLGQQAMFEYAGLMVMASKAGTQVDIDADANGTFETKVTLGEGQSYLVDGGVKQGARVTSTEPVQVQLLTGDVGSKYASRWFSLLPTEQWTGSYYTPVASTNTSAHQGVVFLYNPDAGSAVTVKWQTKAGAQTPVSVPAGGTARVVMPNSGARFWNDTGKTFYAVEAVDDGGTAYDWGMTLLPQERLTPQFLTGLGYGSYPLGKGNNNPVWLTPVGNGSTPVTVYADFNGDGAGAKTDPNGFKYDADLSLVEFEGGRFYDTDGDQTGMLVYVVAPNVKLVAAWGENPRTADGKADSPTSEYAIDAGTGIPPLPSFEAGISAVLVADLNGDGEVTPGDTVRYDNVVRDISRVPVPDVLLTDLVPAHTTYVANSTTKYSSETGTTVPVADDPTGTPFPLDGAGKVLGQLIPRKEFVVSFKAVIDTAAVLPDDVESVVNKATVTAFGQKAEPEVQTPLYGTVTGTVFEDRDRDGVRDAGEPGFANVQVELTDRFGVTQVATTGTAGDYSKSAPAGKVTVNVVDATLPAGVTQTAGTDPNTITAVAGAVNAAGIDGYAFPVGSDNNRLSGFVYHDADNDGAREAGEAGLQGVVISLTGTDYLGATVSRTAVTDFAGVYDFAPLPAGSYTVTQAQPGGWTDGLETVGTPPLGATVQANDKLGVYTFPTAAETTSANNNFGEREVALTGTVFNDANLNAGRDAGEAGLGGVTVALKNAAGATVGTRTTAADGSYTFGPVTPGLYTVLETQPAGYSSSTPDTVSVNLAAVGQVPVNFGDFVCGPAAWTTGESGGSPGGKGTATPDAGDLLLREGDSFEVWAERTLTVPARPGVLQLAYGGLTFDTASTGTVKDAFEAALVDPATGRAVVLPYADHREAAFNVTEGLPAATGPGATADPDLVSFDLSGLTPGTQVKLVARLVNNDHDVNTQVRVRCVNLAPAAPVKFFVVDDAADSAFRYAPGGGPLGNTALLGANAGPASPRGAASNADGSRVWVVDAANTVWVYDGYGTPVGAWRPIDGLADPQGVSANGTDVWLVDAGAKMVYRYAGATAWTSGSGTAADSFPLHSDNTEPTDLVTDGVKVWVTDIGRDEVFVYNLAGALQGRWALDAANGNASGVTLNPAGGTDLWVVDRQDLKVYQYPTGRTQTSGSLTATSTFVLSAGQGRPEGIADPPVVSFGAATYSFSEAVGTAQVEVRLDQSSASPVSVQYMTSNATAVSGQDYQAAGGSVSFSPGQVSKPVFLQIINDTMPESNETFKVNLLNPSGATVGSPNPTTVTIVDNDSNPLTVSFGAATYSFSEGAGTAQVEVRLSAQSGQVVTVQYATSNQTASAGQD